MRLKRGEKRKIRVLEAPFIRIQIKGRDREKIEDIQNLLINLFNEKIVSISSVTQDKRDENIWLAYIYIKP